MREEGTRGKIFCISDGARRAARTNGGIDEFSVLCVEFARRW